MNQLNCVQKSHKPLRADSYQQISFRAASIAYTVIVVLFDAESGGTSGKCKLVRGRRSRVNFSTLLTETQFNSLGH